MKRLQLSLVAAASVLILSFVLSAIGPKRVMAALGYTPVRDVDNPGRQPFALSVQIDTNIRIYSFSVPAGKRLVITHVASDTAAGRAGLYVTSSVNGADSILTIPFRERTNADPFEYYASEQVMDFADAGTAVFIHFFGSGGTVVNVNLTGYYVDVP